MRFRNSKEFLKFMAKDNLKTKGGVLYETFRQLAGIYKDVIVEVYNGYFADCTSGVDRSRLSPANIIDDLATVMYEIEERKLKNGEEIDL